MVDVSVHFGGILYGGNAVRNSVTNTREEHPDSFNRQAEPISMHHKLTPVKKSGSGGWLYEAKFSNKFVAGPYSEISSRRVIYTCDYRRCQIGCPCIICGNDEVTKDKKTLFEDHARYHHALHGTCEFCLQLLSIFPTFNFSRLIRSGPFYNLEYESVKSYVFSHSFTIKKLDKEARLSCPVCDKVFTKISDKKRHVQLVHYEATFPCNVCGKEFTRKDSMTRHFQMVHSDKKPTLQCEVCGSKFGREPNLLRHVKMFHGEGTVPQYSCDQCNANFHTPSGLVVHTRKEHKKFHCDLCAKKFATKFNLDNHLKLKTSCDLCDIKTCTKHTMNAHIRSAHSVPVLKSLFTCPDCGNNFTNKQWLVAHVQKQVISNCDHCGGKFCNIRSRRLHLKKHHFDSTDS